MFMISNFILNFTNLCVISVFLTKLLVLGILFSTVVDAVFVARLLILGTLFSISLILVLSSDLLI